MIARSGWTMAVAAVAATAVLAGCSPAEEEADAGTPDDVAAVELADCPVDALDDVDPGDGPVEVDLWHTEIGLPSAAIDRIASDYNAMQDRVVVPTPVPGRHTRGDAEVHRRHRRSRLAARRPVDRRDGHPVPGRLRCGRARDRLPAGRPRRGALFDDLLPAVRTAYTIDDVLWPAAPIGLSAVMYQNDGHLRAAGLDPSSPPRRWTSSATLPRRIAAAEIDGLDTPVVMRLDAWLAEYWTNGAGEPIVDADNGHAGLATEPRYDNPATAEVLDWIDQMVEDDLLKLTDNADLVAAFPGGRQRHVVDPARRLSGDQHGGARW